MIREIEQPTEVQRTVGVREREQEGGWNPLDDHTPMEEVVSAGKWWSGVASSVMTMLEDRYSGERFEIFCPGTWFHLTITHP